MASSEVLRSTVKIILFNGFNGNFNQTITCIGFHCVVITIVQLYNICLFLVDKVNYFNFIIVVLM